MLRDNVRFRFLMYTFLYIVLSFIQHSVKSAYSFKMTCTFIIPYTASIPHSVTIKCMYIVCVCDGDTTDQRDALYVNSLTIRLVMKCTRPYNAPASL